MTQEQRDQLFEVIDKAREGDEAAKNALLLILEIERRSIILAKLRDGDVREADRKDAHHNVALKVHDRIEQLKITRAYPRWEERIIREECRKWRHDYGILGGPAEAGPSEIEGNHHSRRI